MEEAVVLVRALGKRFHRGRQFAWGFSRRRAMRAGSGSAQMLAFPGFDEADQFSLIVVRHDLDAKTQRFEGGLCLFPAEAHLHINIKRLIN